MAGYWKKYSIAPEALDQARKIGLYSGNLEKWVERMARRSAPFTHPMGNRRFESFILRIENDVVVSICRFDPDTGEIVTDMIGKIDQATKSTG